MAKRPMTSEIIGKAHRIVELIANGRMSVMQENFTDDYLQTYALAIDASVKVHAGDVDSAVAIARPLQPMEIRLPCDPLFVEAAMDWDGWKGTLCALCWSSQVGGIDVVVFLLSQGIECCLGGGRIDVADGSLKFNGGGVAKELRPIVARAGFCIEYALAVMNCANVVMVDSVPPVALNKKRIKAGKVPLYTYKTLNIVSDRAVSAHAESAGSDRVPPRLHLRRGHIRQIAADRMVWVQPCMVGNTERGRVDKAYAVVK